MKKWNTKQKASRAAPVRLCFLGKTARRVMLKTAFVGEDIYNRRLWRGRQAFINQFIDRISPIYRERFSERELEQNRPAGAQCAFSAGQLGA